MVSAIKQELTVQQSGVIEIRSPELRPGMLAEIIILLKDDDARKSQLRRLSSLIGTGKGGFDTPEDADNFIRRERDRWE
ncbi:MAG: hypothetical protein B6245_14410 [Desulfobacteraceae bacterium 4572_88]|nr:MAG: hypothetical protein B6245_14410 [Desulfobacteraceae bacterium 4572_88]